MSAQPALAPPAYLQPHNANKVAKTFSHAEIKELLSKTEPVTLLSASQECWLVVSAVVQLHSNEGVHKHVYRTRMPCNITERTKPGWHDLT